MLWTSWLGRRHAIRSAKAARLSSRSSAAWRPHGRLVPPFVAQVGKAVRKQVYDLTLADFDVAPVWEFASDEEGGRGNSAALRGLVSRSMLLDTAGGFLQWRIYRAAPAFA
jgi:hypothetical protein